MKKFLGIAATLTMLGYSVGCTYEYVTLADKHLKEKTQLLYKVDSLDARILNLELDTLKYRSIPTTNDTIKDLVKMVWYYDYLLEEANTHDWYYHQCDNPYLDGDQMEIINRIRNKYSVDFFMAQTYSETWR